MKAGRPFKYGFERLALGERMSLPVVAMQWKVKVIRSAICNHARKTDKQFITAEMSNGTLRVCRVR